MQRTLPSGKFIGFLVILLTLSFGILTSCSSGKSASRQKAEKEKAAKDREAEKKYHSAIKHHEKIQSDNTKSMMKDARKKAPKNTPLKRSKGKKCKQ